MSSFSLVHRFGKQRKAIFDSPVSSGLVEQHVSPTIAESLHSQIRQPSEVGNVFSGTRATNSHGFMSGLVVLSQHMEGVSIGNIKGNMMSNNNVNINHYYGSAANFDDVLRVGDIYLEEELGRYQDVNGVRGSRYKGQIMASSTLNMSVWSYRGERAAEALEKAYQNYASLPRLSSQQAHSMLEAHNLQGFHLHSSDVDETGKLVIAKFFPGSSDNSDFDTQIWMAFETNTFIKEDLLDYYKFLFDMMDWPTYLTTCTLLSPLDKAAPFQLSHPEINLPVYSIPGWNKVVNGMDITVQETGIVLTPLPNMTIRCCIPTPQIPTLLIFETIRQFEQDNGTLFATWACQANHLIHDLSINIMDLQTELLESWISFGCHAQSIPDWKKDTESPGLRNLLETKHLYLFCPQNSVGSIYWSQDEEGQHIIEDSLIQATFGITVDWHWLDHVYSVPPQYYEILRTIHEACGFDPYGTQVAEYLGVPVAMINNGHSGLEDCSMEDPEYTSESESGDSDYVSASEYA
ncbi:hypothetical protein C8J56DRAFT_1050962 [Mycena floridula]|nr:hypothetical protein C8J56DRAFT_1050962 [Mycena floridula]